MEYEEESMHNALAIAQNAVSVAKNVEDKVLHVMIAPAIAPQPAMPSNPVANLLHILLKLLKSLVIKQVCMLSSKLKATKPQPKLAEAHARL